MKLKTTSFGRLLLAAVTVTFSVTVSHAASLYWDGTSTTADADGGAGTWNTTAANTVWDTAATAGTDVPWTDGSDAVFGGTGGVVTAVAVSTNSITVNTTGYSFTGGSIALAGNSINAGANFSIASALTGTAGMVKTGTGTLTLTGNKAYTGGTTVNAGAINLGTGGGTGTILGTLTINSGGTVNTTVGDAIGYTVGSQVSTLTVNNGGTFNNSLNANQGYSTNVILNGGAVTSTGGGAFNFNAGFGITTNANANTATFSAISIRQGSTMTATVASGTTASGVDLLVTGNVIEGNGTGSLIKAGAGVMSLSGTGTYNGTTSVNAGTLRLANSLAIQNSTLAAGAVVFDQSVASHAFTVGGLGSTTAMVLADNAVAPNPVALTIGNNNAATTQLGILSGAGSLTKIGTGNTTLTGLNTFSGGTNVNAGTLTLGSGGGVGTLRGTVNVNAGATLALTAVNATGFSAGTRVEILNINGGTVNNTAAGDNTWATTFNLTGGLLQSNGGVSSATATQLYTLGRETTGATSGINSLASTATSTISGRLHLRENNAGNSVQFDVADGAAATDLLVSAAITQNASGYGITKTNAGLMVMTGGSTYTGNTNVNGGTLQLGRTGSLLSPVVVNTTGTFRVETSGKTLASLTANNGSSLSLPVETGNTTNVSGALTLTDGATINVSPILGATTALGTYDLLTAAAPITGTGTPVFAPSGGFGASRVTGSVAVNGNKLQLTLTGLGANLVWNNASGGGIPAGTWDLNTSANFLNGASADVFKAYDFVTFDDTVAGVKTITLSGALAPAQVTINSTGAYTFNSTGPLTGSLAGTGSLVKSGNSAATFGTNMGYSMTGDITVAGGTLDFSTKTLGFGKLILTGGAFNNATATTVNGLDLQSGSSSATLNTTAAWTKTTAGTVNLTATNNITGPGTVSAGTLVIGNSTTPTTTGAIGASAVSVASGAAINFYRTNVLSVAASFSGGGALTFNGTNNGTTTGVQSDYLLTGTNAGFSGTVTATGARVYSNITGNFGTATGTTGVNGQFLLNTGGTWPNSFVISGNGWGETLGTLGAIRMSGGPTITGTVTMTGNARITAHTSSGTIAGPIVESGGSRSLEIGGGSSTTGTITLSGASTYTGTTTLTGTHTLNLTGSLGATAVTVGTTASIGGTGSIGSGGSLTFTGPANLNANALNNGLTVNGPVNISSGVTTVNLTTGTSGSPSGVITLLNYTGAVTGTTANLALANAANYRQAIFNVGANKITVDIGGKALFWGGNSGGQWTIGGAANRWNTTGAGGETDVFFQGDSVTFDDTGLNPAITLTGIVQPNAIVVNSNTNNYTFTETAANYIAGNASLTKNGSSNLTLVGASNTFTGGTVVNGGTLTLSTTGGAGTVRGPLTINSGATVVTTVQDAIGYTVGIQVNPLTINGGTFNNAFNNNQGYTTNVIMTGGNITSTGGGSLNFTTGYGITNNASSITSLISSPLYSRDANNLPLTVASGTTPSGIDLDITGIISGNAVTKSGAGSLRVTGANNYTAGTTVAAGKLFVNNTTGSGTGTGAVTVNATGTLGGTGIITGAVTAAGTIAPGQNTTGTLTTGATTLTGTLAIEADGANVDKLVVNGNLTLGGSLTLSTLGGGFTGPYVIATYTGTLTGTFASTPFGYTVNYDTANKQIIVSQATGYALWASTVGLNGSNGGPTQDPDNDGLANLLEYVLMANPLAFSGAEMPGQSIDPNYIHFYFIRSAQSKQDTNVTVQWGTNLSTWNDIAIPDADQGDGVVVINSGNAAFDIVQVNILRSNAANGKIFARLKATPKP